ncbi:hypothetical protein [Modicisalibacter sp. 'Wilcox']|uniref:hypothetical protein n=1 Tax=Modicisalibacter sp. 'Wilcox' TaxID=2679914 RepID=UPI0013CF8495|nr:hypothetical protein [Modicisalibacter sp. 'Wilcox']
MRKGWIAVTAVVAFGAGVLAPIEPFKAEATSYEDCLLDHLTPGISGGAVRLIRQACGKKFDAAPKVPRASSSHGTAPASWMGIITRPEFQSASAEQRARIRDEYFTRVVRPSIPEEQLTEVREAFRRRTQSDIDG